MCKQINAETKQQREARFKVLYMNYKPEPSFDTFVLLPKEIKLLKKMTHKHLKLKDSNKNACWIESLLKYDLVCPVNEFEYLSEKEPYLKFRTSAHGYRWLHLHTTNTRESRMAFVFSVLSLVVSITALLK